MFFVINKEKLTAYAVSVVTVVVLFVMAGTLMPKNNTIETSAEVQKELYKNEYTINSNGTQNKMNE